MTKSRTREECVSTLANVVTAVRTVGALALTLIALHEESLAWLGAGYAVYWIGDMADGLAARWRDEETRIGAVLDIVCDRACTTVCALTLVAIVPEALPAVGVFLLQFCVVDMMLSLSFLPFGILGPNDYAAIDPLLYRLNWSPLAKALNTSTVALLVLVGQPLLATAVAVGLLALKCYGLHRLVTVVWRRTEPALPAAREGR